VRNCPEDVHSLDALSEARTEKSAGFSPAWMRRPRPGSWIRCVTSSPSMAAHVPGHGGLLADLHRAFCRAMNEIPKVVFRAGDARA